MCVCYCNVLLEYSLGTGLLLCVCVTVMCWYGTVWVQGYCYMCVCYCNVLVQYSLHTGLLLCVCVTVMC